MGKKRAAGEKPSEKNLNRLVVQGGGAEIPSHRTGKPWAKVGGLEGERRGRWLLVSRTWDGPQASGVIPYAPMKPPTKQVSHSPGVHTG